MSTLFNLAAFFVSMLLSLSLIHQIIQWLNQFQEASSSSALVAFVLILATSVFGVSLTYAWNVGKTPAPREVIEIVDDTKNLAEYISRSGGLYPLWQRYMKKRVKNKKDTNQLLD